MHAVENDKREKLSRKKMTIPSLIIDTDFKTAINKYSVKKINCSSSILIIT